MSETQPRHNFHADSEAGINREINILLQASYTFLSIAFYFDRDDVALEGFFKFFKNLSEEKREKAEQLMRYQNMRGGRIVLQDINYKHSSSEWGSAGEVLQLALELEKSVNQSLIDLEQAAGAQNDPQMSDFIEDEFLNREVEVLKDISDKLTNIKRVGTGLGVYMFNKKSL